MGFFGCADYPAAGLPWMKAIFQSVMPLFCWMLTIPSSWIPTSSLQELAWSKSHWYFFSAPFGWWFFARWQWEKNSTKYHNDPQCTGSCLWPISQNGVGADGKISPRIATGFILLRKTPLALRFVERWLAACEDRRIMSEEASVLGYPEHPGGRVAWEWLIQLVCWWKICQVNSYRID